MGQGISFLFIELPWILRWCPLLAVSLGVNLVSTIWLVRLRLASSNTSGCWPVRLLVFSLLLTPAALSQIYWSGQERIEGEHGLAFSVAAIFGALICTSVFTLLHVLAAALLTTRPTSLDK